MRINYSTASTCGWGQRDVSSG